MEPELGFFDQGANGQGRIESLSGDRLIREKYGAVAIKGGGVADEEYGGREMAALLVMWPTRFETDARTRDRAGEGVICEEQTVL